MNVYFPTWLRAMVGTVCGVALAAGIAMLARADEWNKLTILTVNQPIQVSDKLLEPGQYAFKLLDSNSNRHIVQIFNRNQTQLVDTISAIPNHRLTPTGDSRFAFWETPTGDARALRAWFYPGDDVGQEFPYPKHLVALETSTEARAVDPYWGAPPPTEPQTREQRTPQATVEQAPQASETTAEQPVPEPEPQPEVAQNNPPEPPPAEPAPPPEPDLQPQTPAELPHTASPYPLIGCAGFAALGLSGLLRRKRSA